MILHAWFTSAANRPASAPDVQGSIVIRKATIMMIAPDNAAMVAEYGGAGNLVVVTPAAMEGAHEAGLAN